MQIFARIREIVTLIPSGKVTTYAAVAKAAGTTPRVVGWALRGNEDQSIPCHRVIRSDGLLALEFSLGNWPEQRRRLQIEGITFVGRQVQNFSSVLFDFNHH